MVSNPFRRGDLILTGSAFPQPDRILSLGVHDAPHFYAWALEGYLRFLEFCVLHDRIVVGYGTLQSPHAEELETNVVWHRFRRRLVLHWLLDIEADLRSRLASENILLAAELVHPEFTPRELFERYVVAVPTFKKEIALAKTELRKERLPPALKSEMAILSVGLDFGPSLYTAAVAQEVHLPFALATWEADRLAPIEAFESRVVSGVAAHLLARLNIGAAAELSRIASLGGVTPYPATPLAWQIVQEADTPGDLLSVALQLRHEYAPFRSAAAALDAELADPNTTTARKLKICYDVENLATSLWPRPTRGFRKEALDAAAFVPLLSATSSVVGSTKLIAAALDKPTDVILAWLRKRRVRVLLKSKRCWLAGGDLQRKLAAIFGVPPHVIKRGFDDLRAPAVGA